jgi:hypothetical protein
MQFSDTTNKNGLIQECEFWTNLGDGAISGNATLLKQFVSRLNRAGDKIKPLVSFRGDKQGFDDTNHTDQPFGTFNLVSGTGDYQILTDDNSIPIVNFTDVMILDSSSSTEYRRLERMTLDDPRALRAMSPNPSNTGVPSAWLEVCNTIFFDVEPNYSATVGGKVFFERMDRQFTSGDTTQTPSISANFHYLYALHASDDWLSVFKSESTVTIGKVRDEIKRAERALKAVIELRAPMRRRAVGTRSRSV